MFNEFAREIEREVEANVKVSFAEGVQKYQLEDIADKKGGAFTQINTLEQCERIYND